MRLPPLSIGPLTRYGPYFDMAPDGGTFSMVNNTWEGANYAIFYPINVPWVYPIKRWFWWNGSVVAGNVDVGLYSAGGTKVVGTGSTAQATVSVKQYVSADYLLQPGEYYLAFVTSSATARFVRGGHTQTDAGTLMGIRKQTVFPLPADMSGTAVHATQNLHLDFGFTLTQ